MKLHEDDSHEAKVRRILDDVMNHGFQAVVIKDRYGYQGIKWELSSCASDCPASPACKNCPAWLLAEKKIVKRATFLEKNLTLPCLWKRHRMVFVCPQGDLFHHDITDKNIAKVFAVMSWCSHHLFLVLTKRAERLGQLLPSEIFSEMVLEEGSRLFGEGFTLDPEFWGNNLIVGVSIEDQPRMERAKVLPSLPAQMTKVMFAAPLLGELVIPNEVKSSLNWVVCNRERGSSYCNPRPCKDEWIYGLHDQCVDAGIPFFLQDRFTEKMTYTMGTDTIRQYPEIFR